MTRKRLVLYTWSSHIRCCSKNIYSKADCCRGCNHTTKSFIILLCLFPPSPSRQTECASNDDSPESLPNILLKDGGGCRYLYDLLSEVFFFWKAVCALVLTSLQLGQISPQQQIHSLYRGRQENDHTLKISPDSFECISNSRAKQNKNTDDLLWLQLQQCQNFKRETPRRQIGTVLFLGVYRNAAGHQQ